MPFSDSFSSLHPALGIDYGDTHIGIAATDDFGIMAHPVETISYSAEKNPIPRICEIVGLRKVQTLVLGLPYRLDGSEGDAAKKVRMFSKKLAVALPHLRQVFVDESFTTIEAAEKLRDAGRKARQQKKIIDQAAAIEILNRWMEEIS